MAKPARPSAGHEKSLTVKRFSRGAGKSSLWAGAFFRRPSEDV